MSPFLEFSSVGIKHQNSRVCSEKPDDDENTLFQISSQHLFRYASEWDPRERGHTKVSPRL